MVISKSDVGRLTPEDQKKATLAEQYIDRRLNLVYQPTGSANVIISFADLERNTGGEFNHRIQCYLIPKYEKAGWKVRVETMSREGSFISFS